MIRILAFKSFCSVVLFLLCFSKALYANEKNMTESGLEYAKNRDFVSALNCFQQDLKKSPESPKLLMYVGNCYNGLGEYEKAIFFYKKAISLGGENALFAGNLSDAYQKMGEVEKAAYWLERACDLDPEIAIDERTQAILKTLKDPLNSPKGSPTSPDYLADLKNCVYWSINSFPIKVFIEENVGLAEIQQTFQKIFFSAFDEWCVAATNHITYKRNSEKNSAGIICRITDDPTKVRADGEIGKNASCEVHLHDDGKTIKIAYLSFLLRNGNTSPYLKNDIIKKLCLHELGHALGMHGHSPNNRDVMFTPADIPTVPTSLSERDKNTIKRLYGEFVFPEKRP